MLHCFDPIRTLSFWAILVRLTLAVICGGVIGAERETKRRPAGFRTHILICLGAAITTLTSQYLLLSLHLFTDVARLGAQVISGIGFIGAGTIIVTRDKRVKGLTTAAGLWAAAIIGLACGAGYVECAVFATLVVLVVELVLIRLEFKLTSKSTDLTLYIEYAHAVCMESVLALLRERRAADSAVGDAAADLRALSPREKQIFRLLADGKSVKAIAGELFISPKTVETHKYNLLTKLKAASVGDLVKIAIRHGLVKV